MKILLTGASSYVGARLYIDLKDEHEVIGTYNTNKLFFEFIKMDITNASEVLSVVREHRPEIIVHVAAIPSIKWCEENPELAVKINEEGTKNVVDAANDIKAKVIYISSTAAIDPNNLYGRTKLAGEELTKLAKAGYVILRPSMIFGYSPNTTNDRPFNRILKNLYEKTPAVYDTSWKFRPTWVGHISEVVKTAIEKGIINQTINITVPELKSRYEIARDILIQFGIEVIPRDEGDTSSARNVDISMLKELALPQYTYSEIIAKIVDEIKHRESFVAQ